MAYRATRVRRSIRAASAVTFEAVSAGRPSSGRAGGGVVRSGIGGTSRDVGAEIDLLLKFPLTRHFVGTLGYSHFFPGDFIRESGSAKDIDFVYVETQFTF